MAKPYSMDLRERVVAAIMAGQRREAVLRRFEISLSSVGRYIRRFREKGALAPDKFGGHKRHSLAGEEEQLREWIKERPDMTLAEIKDRLHEGGIDVGRTAISNFLRHLALSYKKNAARGGAGARRRQGSSRSLAQVSADIRSDEAGVRRRDLGDNPDDATARSQSKRPKAGLQDAPWSLEDNDISGRAPR
jgi:putative transposase